jgi:hypothetical protein
MNTNARPQGGGGGRPGGQGPRANGQPPADAFARLSDIELAVVLTKPLQQRLATELGADGLTLHERISSVESWLDPADVKRARFVSSVRNKLINEVGVDRMDDRPGFIRAAREVDNAITMAVNARRQRPASPAGESFGGRPVAASKSGCFIATAVYGDHDHAQVLALRQFRDQRLLPHRLGRAFVRGYYRVSPPLADWLRHQPRLSLAVRWVLDRVVARLDRRPSP